MKYSCSFMDFSLWLGFNVCIGIHLSDWYSLSAIWSNWIHQIPPWPSSCKYPQKDLVIVAIIINNKKSSHKIYAVASTFNYFSFSLNIISGLKYPIHEKWRSSHTTPTGNINCICIYIYNYCIAHTLYIFGHIVVDKTHAYIIFFFLIYAEFWEG